MPFLRERSGRWSPPKILAFALAVAPALWLAWQAATGMLVPRPYDAALHQAGAWAVRFLLLSLAITPARFAFAAPRLILVRRTIGVAAFGYALLHLVLYAFDQKLDLAKVASEIALRIYLTVGFVTLIGLLALAVTSTDRMIQRLGSGRWNALHRLAYPLAILAIAHFLMQTKLDVSESMMIAGFLAWLLLYRLTRRALGTLGPGRLAGLAVAAAAATALGEAAWYGFSTGVAASRVLMANLDPDMGVRPAGWVLAVGLSVAALAALRSAWSNRRDGAGRGPTPVPARAAASRRVGDGTR